MATVSAETRGAIGLARLDRPEARNALSPKLMEELASLCERWDEAPEIRCIVIAGGDDWFAAGADIKVMAKRTLTETLTSPAASGFARDRWTRLWRTRRSALSSTGRSPRSSSSRR